MGGGVVLVKKWGQHKRWKYHGLKVYKHWKNTEKFLVDHLLLLDDHGLHGQLVKPFLDHLIWLPVFSGWLAFIYLNIRRWQSRWSPPSQILIFHRLHDSPGRYELGQKMIQFNIKFKTKSRLLIIHSIKSKIFNDFIHSKSWRSKFKFTYVILKPLTKASKTEK